jgi:16S rRNA (cytosine967-C5)-methyltransferase
MSPPSKSPRAVAANIVHRWLSDGHFPDVLLEDVQEDRAVVMEIVFGVARMRRALGWVIDRLTRRPPDDGPAAFLMIGLYELLYMRTDADYAVVNEVMKAAKRTLPKQVTGMINAVLRRAGRERADLLAGLGAQPPGTRYSHPDGLLTRWTKRYGEDDAIALCEWNNQPAETVIRVDGGQVSVAEMLETLEANGTPAERHPFRPDEFVVLPRGMRVVDCPGYDEGHFVVQDPAASLSVDMLDPKSGDTVLDACAAPGGKALEISRRVGETGRLVAVDVDEDRCARLNENVMRVKRGHVEIVTADATRLSRHATFKSKTFDKILLDVPCSNTGVLRRRPDARWRFSPERLRDVMNLQFKLLEGVTPLLNPGGVLVYGTCSLEPEENEGLIEDWLKQHAGLSLEKTVDSFPPKSRTDGAYAAAIRKSAES